MKCLTRNVIFAATVALVLFPLSVLAAEEEAMEEDAMAEDAGMEDEGGMLEEEALEPAEPFLMNSVEFGIGYSSEDSFKFGEYNGLEDEGFFAIGNLFLHRRVTNNGDLSSGIEHYFDLIGTNLGLDSRSVYGEYGNTTHNFNIYFDFDQLPHNKFDDAMTPFRGAGTGNQSLLPDWVEAAAPSGMTNLVRDLRQVDVETERQKVGGGFNWGLAEHWSLRGNYHHETKEGTDTIGAPFGTNGGNPRSSTLIFPIDYETDEFDLGLAYANARFQFDLMYRLSLFNDNQDTLTWINPFDNTTWGGAPVGFSDFDGLGRGQGRMQLAPDNMSNMVNLKTGLNLGQVTRVVGNFSFNHMTQNDDFLPMTINPGLAITTDGPTGVPRSDLDGEINNWFANVGLYTRPFRKLSLKGSYTFDKRDNNTPVDTYVRVVNDTADQVAIDDSNARRNRPYSYERHKGDIDATYRLFSRASISAGYTYEQKERDLSEVDTTREHTARVKLSGTPTMMTSGWVRYAHSWRDGDTYISNNPVLVSFSPEHKAAEGCDVDPNDPDCFDQNFLLRKFYQADRDRDQVAGSFSFFPNDVVTFTVAGRYNNEEYDNDTKPTTGLDSRENYSATLDVSFIPREELTTYAFFTYEHNTWDLTGYDTPSGFDPSDAIVPSQYWMVDSRDRIYSFGAGLTWTASEKLDLTLDYSASLVDTRYDSASVGESTGPFPDQDTTYHNVKLTGDYKLNKAMKVRMLYMFEHFNTDDFALDGVVAGNGASGSDRVITLGNTAPEYNAHVVGLSLIYEF